ncbi:MAG: site-2 protease family protein [Candidatus Moranbacteria bacterium]|nr:site-2 protease family protein [Candidatus Moranbacteria bacterium]
MNADSLFYLSQAIAFVIALTVHEFSHALIANKLGDSTAKYSGRLSLNPLKHIDLFGTIIVPAALLISSAPFVFGWAKPVPVNIYNLKGRYGESWVSLAGPASNFIVAIIVALVWRFFDVFYSNFTATWSLEFIGLLQIIIWINVIFGIFNLIPVPPLDGSKILLNLLPPSKNHIKEFLIQYGPILLIAFIFFGGGLILVPLAKLITFFLIGGLLG